MSKRRPVPILIGDRGMDYVLIEPSAKVVSAAFSADVSIRCTPWLGHFLAEFQIGELGRFAQALEDLDRGLRCTAVLKPGDPYLVMTFTSESNGAIHVMGAATHKLGSRVHLEFELNLDHGDLSHIVAALLAADRTE